MAKEDAKVIITGDASGLFKALGDSSTAVKGMTRQMEGAVGGIKNLLMGFAAPLVALSAALGGATFLKDTVEETKTWTVEAQRLARTLGITTEAASVLNLAIGDIYGTAEEFTAVVAKVTRTLNTNEDAFHRLGVATRDANGQYRDTPSIITEVNGKLAQMNEGTARNVASTQIYGKSWVEVQRYLKLTPEVMQAAQEKAERLNLIVGQDAVEATNAYRASMNELDDTVKALKLRLGSELMPVMTEFNNMAAEKGPTALGALGAGIKIVRTQFETFLLVIRTGFEFMKLGFLEAKNLVVTFANVMEQVQAGNLGGAKDLLLKGKDDAKKIFSDFLVESVENGRKLKESITLMWAPKNEAMGPEQEKKKKEGGGGDGKGTSDPYAAYESLLTAEANVRKERKALWEKHQDDLFEVYGNELDREERKINQHHDTMLQNARQFGAEQTILDQIEVEREVALQNARTDAAAKASEKRRQIERDELEERRRVLEATGTAQQGFLDGINQYLQRQGSTFQQWAQSAQQLLQSVEGVFARTMQGILTGQIRGTQILRTLWQGLGGAVIQALAQMAAKWLVATIAAKIFKDTASSAAKENAVAQQQSAASTLWATYSGIPFVGPALAAGFIALMNASLIANTASAHGITGAAAGGWFDRPTLTMIGEGARPELVVPDVAFKDFAGNLASSILAQERQAQGYARQASGYASASSGGGAAAVMHVENHYHQNAPNWDPSERSKEAAGRFFNEAMQVHARRSGQVMDTAQPFGARL